MASVPVADPELGRRLRALFRDADFTAERIQEVLGTGDELVARTADRPVYDRRLGGDTLSALIRLFVLGTRPVRTVFTEEQLALLHRAELVEDKGEKLAGAVRIVPHDELLIASDFAGDQSVQHVAGVHRPSHTLARLTVRTNVERALDVGTGNGIQALLAARHSRHVVATDVNQRALRFAAFNGALNGVANVELREGSYLEPVAGETFDLVVANPPYVISPESRYLFRDSGLPGDSVSEQLVRGLPSVLAEGGFATVMISWAQRDRDAPARPRSWVEGSGCDAYLVHTRTEDPLSTAAAWNRDLAAKPGEFGRTIDEWVRYFRSEKIPAIAYGAIVLRRRSGGSNWFHATKLPRRGFTQSDVFLRRVFASLDLVEQGDLGARTVELANEARIEETSRLDAGWQTDSVRLRLTSGLLFDADLDDYTTALLRQLDGTRTLDEALAAAAGETGADPEQFATTGAALVTQLLAKGFVTAR